MQKAKIHNYIKLLSKSFINPRCCFGYTMCVVEILFPPKNNGKYHWRHSRQITAKKTTVYQLFLGNADFVIES